jgi:undecaprenyl-diphosphatase
MVDTRWYLLVNGWAKSTPMLHGVAAWHAVDGVALFVLALIAACWRTRRGSDRAMATALWAGGGTVVVVGVNQLFVAGFHRIRAYWVLAHVGVLVPKTHDVSFPSGHAVTAGALASGRRLVSRATDGRVLPRLALAEGIGTVLLAADRVYVRSLPG